MASISIHDEDLRLTAARGCEHEMTAVGRPARALVHPRLRRQLAQLSVGDVVDDDVEPASLDARGIGDLLMNL